MTNKVNLNIEIDKELRKKIKELAKSHNLYLREYIANILIKEVGQHERDYPGNAKDNSNNNSGPS